MPAAVPPAPEYAQLGGLVVGRPVKAGDMRHLSRELLFLLGRCLPVVSSQVYSGALGQKVVVAYNRTPGAQVLLAELEFSNANSSDTAFVGAVVASSGTVSVIETGRHVLDAATSTDVTTRTQVKRDTYRVHLDVTGLTVGTTVYLAFIVSDTKAGDAQIYRITLAEVPIATASPADTPATEVGLDAAWPQARNAIVAGDTSQKLGWVRAFGQLAKARAEVRRHFQLSCAETASTATWRTETNAAGTAFPFGLGNNPTWRVRARRLYTTATANAYTLRARYYAPSGAFTLRCVVTPVGGAPANTDLALASNGGFDASSTVALNLPTSGTGQECDIQFQLWRTSGTGFCNVSNIEILEAEV
jgi:hypothetical protein